MHTGKKERKLDKLKKAAYNRKEIREIINHNGADILRSNKFISTKGHVQHGNVSVNEHCKNVAVASLRLNRALRLNGNSKEIVRGALLHDYFLYDWHNRKTPKGERMHGYSHPMTALGNAKRDYILSDKQKDIIANHMWPLTITKIPKCKEAWIVTAADKYCSLMETIGVHKSSVGCRK